LIAARLDATYRVASNSAMRVANSGRRTTPSLGILERRFGCRLLGELRDMIVAIGLLGQVAATSRQAL